MIALVKIYKRMIQKEGYSSDATGAQPYALYSNGEIEVLDENELLSIFPNTGRVFITESFIPPQKEIFRFYELIESNTFDTSRIGSMKYFLGKEIFSLNLYEVIDLDETINNDKQSIIKLLSKGISIPFVVSNEILFRTADDYLIGPLQMEFKEGIYLCKDKELNFIPYFQQDVDIAAIFDTYRNQERLFCSDQLESENIVGWIDVANEQRVISDALKQLKDNADLTELSRKMIGRLKDWYGSDKAQGPHLQERLQRAIQIMEGHTLSDDTISLFTELVLDLEITKTIIEQQIQKDFEKEYDKFLKENEKLAKENNNWKQELERLKNTYYIESQALDTIKVQYSGIQKTMQNKIEQLQNEFSTVYAEQLALSNLLLPQLATATSSPNNTQRVFAQLQSIIGESLLSFNDFKYQLNNNLINFKGNDENGALAATILTAVILGEPVIIYGNSSFELAQCIAKTIASEQTLTVIPEIETFSLNELHHQYSRFSMSEVVKALIIHNPHTTAALYSLPTFFKQNKWVEDMLTPDLTFITIDSIEEATPFIERMPYIPLINSVDYISRFMNKRNFKALQSGQVTLGQLEISVVEENSFVIRRDFREWIEDVKDLDVEIPFQLVEWLNQLKEFMSEDELYEWCFKIFQNVIKIKQNDLMGVGV